MLGIGPPRSEDFDATLVTGIRSDGGEVTGLVDFGDLVESHTLFELAVCTAYAMLGKTDPVAAAAQVVGGYHRVNPLTEHELELLYDLIAMRLCTSVTISRTVTLRTEMAGATATGAPVPSTARSIADRASR